VVGLAGAPGIPRPESRAVSATCGGIRVVLQADRSRPPLIQPRQKPRHPLLHRIDVPGRDPHRRHRTDTADGGPSLNPAAASTGSSNPARRGSARTASPLTPLASLRPCSKTTERPLTIARTKRDRPPPPRQTSATDDTKARATSGRVPLPRKSEPTARPRALSRQTRRPPPRRSRTRACLPRRGPSVDTPPATREKRSVLPLVSTLRSRF
jgi:hypothetical protein